MIQNFAKVTDNLYRGAAPTVEDVKHLKTKYGINKIVSLDAASAAKINRICKLLAIEHIIIPIEPDLKIKPLIQLFSYNLKKLLTDNGPVFVHCFAGKDRTGMLIAVFRCKYMGWSCEDALKEAKSFGFGIGLPDNLIRLYSKLICTACKKSHSRASVDENAADIVDQSRSAFHNSLLGTIDFKSFAPFLDTTRQYPYDGVYNSSYDQSLTRENYKPESKGENVPLVGVFDGNSGIKGDGFVDAGGASSGILSEDLV